MKTSLRRVCEATSGLRNRNATRLRPRRENVRFHSRRRSARFTLAWGLIAFLVASFALSLALETNRPEWRDPEFGHRLPLLQSTPARPLVLVIGTSRTQNGIAPRAMDFPEVPGSPRVVNFGQSAATPLKELLTLHRVLDAGVRPAAVVVELFPPSLAVNETAEEQFASRAARLSARDLAHLAPFREDTFALSVAWLRSRAVPWLAQRQVLMNHVAPRWQPREQRIDSQWESLDADGFQPVAEVSPERRATLAAIADREYADAFIGFHPGNRSVEAVRALVAFCRERAIPVVFFVPPISPAFRGKFAPGVLPIAGNYLNSLAGELNVPVFPAMLDLTDAEVMDGHHLLRHGAERYSRWLAEHHLKPWLASLGGNP